MPWRTEEQEAAEAVVSNIELFADYVTLSADGLIQALGGYGCGLSTQPYSRNPAMYSSGADGGMGYAMVQSENVDFQGTVDAVIITKNPCEGDFDTDGDVDGSDLAIFAADFGRTDCLPENPCQGNFDGDSSDLAVFAADFGRTDCPVSLKTPYIKGYSNSGCLDMSYGAPEEYPGCGEDEIIARVEGDSIFVAHRNATYNCCPDDIEVTLSSQGNILTLYEKEILTTPCDCMCCYNIHTEFAGLTPGEYTIVVWWQDWETHGELCKTVKVIGH